MSVSELIEEYKSRGGLLGLLKEYVNKLNEYPKRLYEIWRSAFPTTRVTKIDLHEVGRYYGLFKGILARVRPERKATLEPYFREFERVYNELREFMPFSYTIIENLIKEGEDVTDINHYADYRFFLADLHEWINKVCFIFGVHRNSIEKHFPDFYKYAYKMIKIVVDISTDYVGNPRLKGSFEFTYGTFVHIENFIHISSKALDTGIFMPYLMYIINLMLELSRLHAYDIVFPSIYGGRSKGDWDVTITEIPFEVTEEDLPYEVSDRIVAMAAQIGVDVKDHYAELTKISTTLGRYIDEFPAYFVILDYLRSKVRVEASAILPWDYFKYPVGEVARLFR